MRYNEIYLHESNTWKVTIRHVLLEMFQHLVVWGRIAEFNGQVWNSIGQWWYNRAHNFRIRLPFGRSFFLFYYSNARTDILACVKLFGKGMN